MRTSKQEVEFDSGTGFFFESLTFRHEHGISAEALFRNRSGRMLYLELRGVQSPHALLEVLAGFDDFQISKRDPGTPFAETGRFLCRFWIDESRYETVVDEYEAYEAS